MGALVGASIDVIHALLMAIWILGLPLLFWHRWPRVSLVYAYYAVAFVLINQISYALLGECLLTTLARAARERMPEQSFATPEEWFSVRLAEAIFHLTPSHRAIKLVSEFLVLVTAAGIVLRRPLRRRPSHGETSP